MRLGVPVGEAEQMVGRGAGERVDRLVVVADDADVVAVAEPPVEQRRLQRVHVLVLVDRERVEPFADRRRPRPGTRRTSGPRAPACPRSRSCPSLPCAARSPRRCACISSAGIGGSWPVRSSSARYLAGATMRFFAHSISPASSRARQELVRRRQRVRERGDQRRLVVEHVGTGARPSALPQLVQVRQRRRVERPGLDALDAEPGQPALELARGLLGERDRQDLLGRERVGGDLVGDPMRDRGRLAGAGAGQDGDRAAVGAGRLRCSSFSPARISLQRPPYRPYQRLPTPPRRGHRLLGEPRYPGPDDAASSRSASSATPATRTARSRTSSARNLLAKLERGERAVPRASSDSTRSVLPASRAGHPRRPRPDPARRARPGEDPAGACDSQPA